MLAPCAQRQTTQTFCRDRSLATWMTVLRDSSAACLQREEEKEAVAFAGLARGSAGGGLRARLNALCCLLDPLAKAASA